MTEEPGDLARELVSWQQRRDVLVEHNKQELTSLARMGAQVDGGSITRTRLEVLVNFLFSRMGGIGDEERLLLVAQYEVAFEEKVSEQLNDIKAEVRKAMLTAGSDVSAADLKSMFGNGNGGAPGLFRGRG